RHEFTRPSNGSTFAQLYPCRSQVVPDANGDLVCLIPRRAPGFTGEPDLNLDEAIDLFIAVPEQMKLGARGDGSALQFAANNSQVLTFPRLPNGTFQPYEFCTTIDRSFSSTATFGSHNREPSPNDY